VVHIPVGWERDPSGAAEGFVPPGALGRLSIFTQQARDKVVISDEFALEHASRLLPKARRFALSRAPSDVVERLAADHLAVGRTGKADGRHYFAIVHVFPPGLIVYAKWHTPERNDPDWADGVAAARSIAPM
jgi:hypothetical protein